ncbi:Uma2 family endonuclease [Neolewinella sp.]|uniref:Uma2 family endonuclease n=1 Tax=Neolewinella sp. TaxID=2993543 RepID=UPI003B523A86
MNAKQLTQRYYTREDYFALLRTSQHKYEYLNGRVKMMAGGTVAHADIVGNTYYQLRAADHNCKINNSEMAVSVQLLNKYFFPDASAVCEAEAAYEPGGGIARLTNPALLVEVLSEGTADYDRTTKFSAYRQLPSFREYLLIDSRRYNVETYYREQSDLWRIANYQELDQEVRINTLNITLPLSVFYEGVVLDPEPPAVP